MLIEDSHLNTVVERMETDLLFGCLFSILWYGEREPGLVNSKCVHFICYVQCAELRRFLVNEDNQILHKVPSGILQKEAFRVWPRPRILMFFQNPRVLLGFGVFGRSLMSRTPGFPLKLQTKQLLLIILHSKISQRFQMVEERSWCVEKHLDWIPRVPV